jgi:hypothetical protein
MEYEIEYTEKIENRTRIIADSEEEAIDKFYDGDYIEKEDYDDYQSDVIKVTEVK